MNFHPVIGDKPPKELLASDILALPEREQQAWVHAAVSMAIQVSFVERPARAQCMTDWYFYRGQGKTTVRRYLEGNKTERAVSVVYATLTSACLQDD